MAKRYAAHFRCSKYLHKVNFISKDDKLTENKAFDKYFEETYPVPLKTVKKKMVWEIEDSDEIPLENSYHETVWDSQKFPNGFTVLDIETTGRDKFKDCTIEFCAMKFDENGELVDTLEFRCKPPDEVEISEGAYSKHGISGKDLKDKYYFDAYMKDINEFIGDTDLVGHNATFFDFPIIAREFERAGKELNLAGKRYYDTFLVHKRKKVSKLANIYFELTGNVFPDAHKAKGDVLATKKILSYQWAKHGDDAYTTLFDPSGLLNTRRVDDNEKGKGEYVDEIYFQAGKNKGKNFAEVYQTDINYLNWACGNDNKLPTQARELFRRLTQNQTNIAIKAIIDNAKKNSLNFSNKQKEKLRLETKHRIKNLLINSLPKHYKDNFYYHNKLGDYQLNRTINQDTINEINEYVRSFSVFGINVI